MALNPNNMSIAYRLGRFFAVVEKIRRTAKQTPDVDGWFLKGYDQAFLTPRLAFAEFNKLVALDLHYCGAQRETFEQLIAEIVNPLTDTPPENYSIEQQGEFTLGYWHQKVTLQRDDADA